MNIINDIIKDLKAGQFVLVTDSHERENEADLLMAAEFISKEKINFLINHARGLITNPISHEIAKNLNLPLMIKENTGTMHTAFTVSIDLIEGTHTGISSTDRAMTMKRLSETNAKSTDFERPGHVFPLIAHGGGVNLRPGHTEAAIDLLKLSNLNQVAVLCETLNIEGNALVGDELLNFSKTHNIKIISIDQIKQYLNTCNL